MGNHRTESPNAYLHGAAFWKSDAFAEAESIRGKKGSYSDYKTVYLKY